MPHENEIKYVLSDPEGKLRGKLEAEARGQSLEQHYLGNGCRVRIVDEAAGSTHWFTFKRECGGKLIEVETKISAEDFALLRATSEASVTKRRFKIRDGKVDWDVDFLADGGRTYAVIAEAEMPEGMEAPPRVLKALRPHVVACVGRDPAWTNRRLSDPAAAAELIAGLKAA